MSATRMRETRNEARRRVYRRRRQVAAGGLLLCCGLLVLAGFKVADALPGGRIVAAASKSEVQVAAPVFTPVTTPEPKPSIRPAPTTPHPAQTPTETVSARATTIRATGVYAIAPGGTARQGSGTLKTYSVEVETGTAQSAPTFAAAVDATLANPASWAGQGRWSLQRVTPDRADIVIRLATPATVDKVCATVGLDTIGYVSCRAGKYVMINLERWLKAVPDYRGDVALYRQYVINHEVGHQLGYGHQSCPGPGRRAPVMQQQTFGLKGCLP
ncbi:MAG TPA: DUF3152 domain-containing protein, partial [Dermatophilaceae bacterium]